MLDEALAPKLPTSWIAGLAGLTLVIAGVCGYSCRSHHQVVVAIKKADVAQAAEVKDEAKGDADDKQLEADAPILAADDAAVTRLEDAQPAPAPAPPHAPTPDPQPVGLPAVVVGDPRDQALIQALQKDLADTQQALHTAITAAADYKQAAQDSQAEAAQLRAALTVRQKAWAVGGLYGTDSSLGAWVERDLGVVRVGVDVVRRPIAGGQTTLEAIARLGIRF